MGSKNSEVNEEQEPADMNALHGLLRNVSIVLNVKREIDKNEKFDDCFTVFSALNIENLELKHCQMIANLLNPDGKHGMGTSFLNLFFKIVLDKQIADNDHPKIYTEYDTKNAGRMDLYIETETACYPIEVKIKAGDQDCQLSRYYKYVEKKSDNNLTIFYLTLDGHKPSEKSVNGLTEKDLNNVKRKSFEKHIIPWLKKCAELSYKYPNVYSAIHQYITLIEKLTLKSKEEKLQEDLIMTSIKDIISLSGQYFNAAKEIAEHFENVQPDKMKDVFRKIKVHMSKYNLSCRYEQDKIRKFYCGEKRVKEDSSPSLEFELCKHDDIVLNLVFAICGKAEEDDQFYYGIKIGFLSDKTNEVKYDNMPPYLRKLPTI